VDDGSIEALLARRYVTQVCVVETSSLHYTVFDRIQFQMDAVAGLAEWMENGGVAA
jgi:hypothetical protein